MARRDYMSEQQLKAEQLRRQSMEVALEKINGELRMLDMFTKPRTLTDLNAKYTEAQRALERTKAEAKAKEEQARIERETKKKVFEKELMRYKDIEEQIRRCIITAPQDGIVVYYVSEQAARGMGSQQSIIAQNEPVREGQKLMRIPDLRRMVVNTKVHEAMISRIRGDLWQSTGFVDTLRVVSAVQPDAIGSFVADQAVHELRERFREQEMKKVADGMRATIRIEAFPDQLFHGHVKSVATVAAKTDWTSADVKTYQTMVSIDESLVGLKPDMNAEVTIYVDSTDQPVLTVPLQAVVGGTELGRTRKVFVMTPEGPKERDVVIGLSNEKLVEVKEGLEEGEEVILNPKVILGDKVKTRQVIEGDPRGGEGGGRGKGKGGRGGKSKFGGGIPPDGGMPGGGGGSK
jgi:multidrug efflux pump subunit AcrA (membrane-fusion protein)